MSGIQDFRFSDLLPRNMRPEDLIPLLAGLAMLAVCFAVKLRNVDRLSVWSGFV